ncbi:hypothetical protein A2U01_0006411, partial [Trifolium medium]|nr:hypothetical protein [Trifolium medium]
CSQFDDPLKKSSLDSDDQVSKTELCEKRKNSHSENQGSISPATRILRSMMKTTVVLPRRSPRLISKLLALFTETCKSYFIHPAFVPEFMKCFVRHLKALVPDFSMKISSTVPKWKHDI